MHEVLRRRKAQQEERIATARTYAERLRQRLGALTAWLYGSVAQGTFKTGATLMSSSSPKRCRPILCNETTCFTKMRPSA